MIRNQELSKNGPRHACPRAVPTVVYLDGPLVGEHSIQGGVIARAKARNISLYVFAGGMLECPREFEAQRSVIFDLVNPELADGFIIGSDYLGHSIGTEKIREFSRKFLPKPLVTNELLMQGIPTLVTNFYQGMYDILSHLIEVHHYSKIAFIRGLEHSHTGNERYQAYLDALRDHSLPFDERLVAPGHFFSPSGQKAVDLFFDQRGLRPSQDIDAIAAVTDFIANDTIFALHQRGLRVPDDIAVVGFDDDEEASSADPPLTTVHLPFYEMGEWAVDTILSVIDGENPPDISTIPVSLVLRQSCGCVNPAILEVATSDTGHASDGKRIRELVSAAREAVVTAMANVVKSQKRSELNNTLRAYYDLCVEELIGENPGASRLSFIRKTEALIKSSSIYSININLWTDIQSAMRRELIVWLNDAELRARFEDICRQVQILVGDMAQQQLSLQKWQAKNTRRLLHDINQVITTALDVPELMNILADSLPRLDIPGCYLALYDDQKHPTASSVLALAYDDRGRLEIDPVGSHYPSSSIVPGSLLDPNRPHVLVVEPLYFRDEQLGFILFEAGPVFNGPLYEALAEQISINLKRINLHRIAEEARKAAEQADRLKTRFLSTVSHELRTPLGMIISLSELLLQEGVAFRHALPPAYEHELEVIHATGQHLDRLLRDVLDLGRSQLGQLKLFPEMVEFREILREAAIVGEELAREKGLRWRLQSPASLPRVWGDRTRLRQILLNLISNACKFTTQGEVLLDVQDTGDELVISVQDTGLGVPLKEQATIFDEFYQSERTAARGYGGMGLGLAITRRLVQMHGGRIWVQSTGQEGNGATFSFSLPVMPAAGKDKENISRAAEWQDAVLIIAREGEGSPLLRRHLERSGYRVAALQFDEAGSWLSRIAACAPGAIVLDCGPSEQWGLDVMKALKENPSTKDLPVLITCLSGEDDRGSMVELDYLVKPLGLNTLAKALERRGVSEYDKRGKDAQTILVVDDEPAVLELHANRVRAQLPGSRVLEARNGLQALDIMQQVRPDLVILDLMMPELDGFGVLEKMREMESTRDIPVIVMTAQTLTEDVMERLNRGVASILGKGIFSREEILRQVESALSRNKCLGNTAQRIARRAMTYLHEHYADPLTREEIARSIGVNERYLTRCFREETGIAPMEYLSRYRVRQAKKLLEEGEISITEIALEVGFSSSAYFSRVFHKETGIAPLEYRHGKRNRENQSSLA